MATRVSYPIFKALTADATLAESYKLYTYEAGTSTPLETYSDAAATTPHTNPIILNALGEKEIFITESAKFTLTDADDNTITGWPIDNIDPTTVAASEVSFDVTATISSTDVQGAIEELESDLAGKADSSDIYSTMPTGVEVQGNITGFDCVADTDADHDVSVAAGACMDSTNTTFLSSSSALVKQLDAAWAVGTGAGGLLNGSIAANTIYHLYALYKTADGSVDFGWVADGDAIASYMPAGYSKFRWLRFHLTNSSSNIIQTTQNGDYINHHKASDWVVSSGIITTYATVDHSSFVPGSRIELIEYGARDATLSYSELIASDDGTNVSYLIGSTQQTVDDTELMVWGGPSHHIQGFLPFYASRQFKSETGTIDLLIHAVKLKR